MRRFNVKDRVALVTGAGSGIGQAVAISLARRGAHVALVDINRDGLHLTAELVKSVGKVPTTHLCDVTSSEDVAEVERKISAEYGSLEILVNNAGVALLGGFAQYSVDDFEWLINVNLLGMVRLIKAFLPMLGAASEAQIVNLSSIFGIVALGNTAYCASKFAVSGFSQSLRQELKDTNIGLTVVYPGGVKTRIVADARIPSGLSVAEAELFLQWARANLQKKPEDVGERIAQAIEKRSRRILIGGDAKFFMLIERLFPVSHVSILQRLIHMAF